MANEKKLMQSKKNNPVQRVLPARTKVPLKAVCQNVISAVVQPMICKTVVKAMEPPLTCKRVVKTEAQPLTCKSVVKAAMKPLTCKRVVKTEAQPLICKSVSTIEDKPLACQTTKTTEMPLSRKNMGKVKKQPMFHSLTDRRRQQQESGCLPEHIDYRRVDRDVTLQELFLKQEGIHDDK